MPTALQHLFHHSHRIWAMVLAAASLGAMLYVELYQSRAIRHIWCPAFSKGCEAVADAPFAKPFGIPDGYIAAAMYAMIFLLLLRPGFSFVLISRIRIRNSRNGKREKHEHRSELAHLHGEAV